MTAQKREPFQVIAHQLPLTGSVRAVHVIPSGEVAAAFEYQATVQKTEPFQAIAPQSREAGSVRAVHVIPLGDVMAAFEGPEPPPETAQNTVPFHVSANHLETPAIPVFRSVHVIPSGDVITRVPDWRETAQKIEPFQATETQPPAQG